MKIATGWMAVPEGYPGKTYTITGWNAKVARKHHIVWWQNTGKLPGPGYVISFKNKNSLDCRFENLYEKLRYPKLAGVEREIVHGMSGYGRGCRCEVCKKGKADYTRRWVFLGGKRRKKDLTNHTSRYNRRIMFSFRHCKRQRNCSGFRERDSHAK